MSLQTQVNALVTVIGADIKALRVAQGDLSTLTTTAKGSLVAALNELKGLVGGASGINDSAASASSTYSSTKINAAIAAAVAALVGSAPTTLDQLNELATALGNDPNYATTIATALGLRVRVDAAQAFTAGQQTQARTNIGAASAADLGDPAFDFVAAYTAAKA